MVNLFSIVEHFYFHYFHSVMDEKLTIKSLVNVGQRWKAYINGLSINGVLI